jgi:prolyl-tRNA synthetase
LVLNYLSLTGVATELASGPAFESRVRSILRDHVDNNSLNLQTSPESSAFVSSALEEEPHDHWRNALTLVDGIPSPTLLSKQESRRLFERFSSLMGINQHFLDPRTFSDSMDLLYQNETLRIRQMQTMWYTEYLLVMAMGMLIGSPSEGSANPPGNSFFAEAIHRLPPMHKLGSHGILSVEILCLASLYLQWCDRKYDAYLYVRPQEMFLILLKLTCGIRSVVPSVLPSPWAVLCLTTSNKDSLQRSLTE